ncbi:hypothetical protein [Novosphingobium sp. B1]|uniref:hypothetical protein n=1 Tax=Novosphingobium sp. B1 TaxID=1938756 RepID=UPI000A030B10|nr:hypothetical protein [Novosphingobium sp. B1]
MKSTFDLMRLWAMLTGLVLAGWYFGELYFGAKPTDTLPMLIAAIGGFELFHCAQDILIKRGRTNG